MTQYYPKEQLLFDLSSKTVIVTGGANSIGAETVRQYATNGANVVIADLPSCSVNAAILVGTLPKDIDVNLKGNMNVLRLACLANSHLGNDTLSPRLSPYVTETFYHGSSGTSETYIKWVRKSLSRLITADTKWAIEKNRDVIIEVTRWLRDHPYMEDLWWRRARALLDIGLPELAAADGYKGMMLIKAGFDYRSHLGEKARLNLGLVLLTFNITRDDPRFSEFKGDLRECIHDGLVVEQERLFYIMIESLILVRSPVDLILTYQEAVKLYPHNSIFARRLADSFAIFKDIDKLHMNFPWADRKQRLLYGLVPARNYPWMTPELGSVRTPEIINDTNSQLRRASDCLESDQHQYSPAPSSP
ncbi:hypothetical protein DL98DRAFT_581185 [Cadophora sp. DSE1049]|nr:hypothetical protein DL98DRAFT_581185 [Cadophora sp. DSE1049]